MVDGSGFFTPFVEAKDPRPSFPDTHTSGSYTVDIDGFRQGVEVTSDKYRYAGTLPKLGTGENDHELSIIVFGQSQEFQANVAFEELLPFDPVLFIQNQDALIFPVVLDNESFEDPERFGGIIEPLSVGSRDLLLSVTEFEPHDVRAHLQDGNDDSFRKVDRVSQTLVSNEIRQTNDLYIDASDNTGTSGSISLPGFFPESEKVIMPFDESRAVLRWATSGTLAQISSPTVRAAVQLMTGSSTDEYIPAGVQSMGAGHTYSFNVQGTDSLAFGGLRRS